MSVTIVKIVKLRDAMKHEPKWCVVVVRVSARIVGSVSDTFSSCYHTPTEASKIADQISTEEESRGNAVYR